jgi:hypothetical protein
MYSPGELRKLAQLHAKLLARMGWAKFWRQHHHHQSSSIHPVLNSLSHPAAHFLHRLSKNGVPALCSTPPWTVPQQGYWLVLPYSAVRGHPSLRIAPAGVVPQRDRRPRAIIDYTYNGVNRDTLPLEPTPAMQFGLCLQRILQRLAYCNPQFGPPLLAKVDLADGYYRIPLTPSAALTLAVVLPSDGLTEPLLGLPLSLPMGWKASPPPISVPLLKPAQI